MRRFTLPPERLVDGRVTFDTDESRHLSRVLRLRAGDTVVATDGAGRDYTVRLDNVGETTTGTVLDAAPGTPPSPLAITLVQGVPKGDKMEAIVRAEVADVATLTVEPAPLVLANLLAAAHRAFAARYTTLVAAGGVLVAGGLLDAEADGVAHALAAHGFHREAAHSLEGWTSLALRHAPLHAAA